MAMMKELAIGVAAEYADYTGISFEKAMAIVTGDEQPLQGTERYLEALVKRYLGE